MLDGVLIDNENEAEEKIIRDLLMNTPYFKHMDEMKCKSGWLQEFTDEGIVNAVLRTKGKDYHGDDNHQPTPSSLLKRDSKP